jgi:hypothetical protein
MEYAVGAFLFHLWSRPRRTEWISAVVLGLVLRVLYELAPGTPHSEFSSSLMGIGPFLGAGSLLVMTVTLFQLKGEQADARMRMLITCAGIAFIAPVLQLLLAISMRLTPYRYDPILCAIDGSFGFQPSFLFGQLAAHSRVLKELQLDVYYCLVLAVGMNYAAHAEHRAASWPVDVLRAYVTCTVLAFFLYIWLPAAGPGFAFHDAFPNHPPALFQIPVRRMLLAALPTNAIPSVHAATAYLVWWNSRPWKWGRIAAGAFALLTLVATMGTGEHYMVDLIVAAPFALVSQAIATKGKVQVTPLLAGSGLVALWLVPARLWPSVLIGHSITVWLLALVTAGATAILARRLLRATYEYREALEKWAPGPVASGSFQS